MPIVIDINDERGSSNEMCCQLQPKKTTVLAIHIDLSSAVHY